MLGNGWVHGGFKPKSECLLAVSSRTCTLPRGLIGLTKEEELKAFIEVGNSRLLTDSNVENSGAGRVFGCGCAGKARRIGGPEARAP